MEISRREFLRLLGMTTAGVSLAGLGCDSMLSVPDEMYERIAGSPRIETWKTSVCSLCPAGCGIKARLIDGVPVRIQGNPIHPVNRGGTCPMAEAGVEMLFHPDRLKGPLKRTGERGENQWQSITWEEGLQMLTTRLQALRAKKEAHKLAFLSGPKNNLLATLIERFMQGFGSPNLFHFDETQFSRLATYLTQGHENLLGYDFKNINLLINFGGDLLDAGPSPVRFNQLYSELRSRENGQRTKIIHIDSRLSRTAGNSNMWIPIKPGTMAALALGMANVMIKDRQYAKGFIKTSSFGFDGWSDQNGAHEGFKSFVSREYSPEKVAQLTGVAASKIVELAREFASAKSALVIAGGQAAQSSNGLYTIWAIDCLNALKGNYETGGPFFIQSQPPFSELQAVQLDESARKGLSEPNLTQTDDDFCFADYAIANWPKSILDRGSDAVEILLVANVNPVFNSVNQHDLIAALKKIPLIVNFSPFLDETNEFADLVLPDHTFLEKYEVLYNGSMAEFRYCGVQQPVIEPIYDTRHTGDVLLQISQSLDDTISSALSWPDYETYVYTRLAGIYKTGAGTIFTERFDEEWLRFLKERGWQIFEYTNMEEFWQTLLDKGGWWDPFPEKADFSTVFATPSRKFEFYSQILKSKIESHLVEKQTDDADINKLLQKWKIVARGDLVYLPHFEAHSEEETDRFDLHLLTHNLITNQTGIGNIRLLQEIFGLLSREYWRSYVEMNPETALRHGISDGEMVKVTSPRGNLKLQAKIHPGIMPEAISIPFGLGHKVPRKRYAREIGVNPYEILVEDYDFLNGRPTLTDTKVRLEKIGRKEQV